MKKKFLDRSFSCCTPSSSSFIFPIFGTCCSNWIQNQPRIWQIYYSIRFTWKFSFWIYTCAFYAQCLNTGSSSAWMVNLRAEQKMASGQVFFLSMIAVQYGSFISLSLFWSLCFLCSVILLVRYIFTPSLSGSSQVPVHTSTLTHVVIELPLLSGAGLSLTQSSAQHSCSPHTHTRAH